MHLHGCLTHGLLPLVVEAVILQPCVIRSCA